jgi:hypothetical protein
VDKFFVLVLESRSSGSVFSCLARGFRWCHRRSFDFATEVFFSDFILRQQILFSLSAVIGPRRCPNFVLCWLPT